MKIKLKKIIKISPLFLLLLVLFSSVFIPITEAAPQLKGVAEYTSVCNSLKKIKGQKLSSANCKKWKKQADQDKAVQNICGKYGDNKLKNECSAYSNATSSGNSNGNCTSTNCTDPAMSCSDNSCDLIAKYINPAIDLLTVIFGLIAVISIIAGGIQYASSTGDAQKVSAAKKRITNTLIAIIAYFLLYGFLQFLIPGGAFKG
ncbi:MAG: hypothetical protein NVS1B10_04450 [Candidatus Saccharimonadales bacterium]